MKHILLFFIVLININAFADIKIITSLYPLKSIISEVAGEKSTVINVIPAGADPHHFEPVASVVKNIGNAQLFIGVNHEFDGWIEKFISSDCKVIYLEKGHTHNEHIWLTPDDCISIADKISGFLMSLDSENGVFYENCLGIFSSRMLSLGAQIKEMFSGIQNRTFIQYHSAWDHFAEFTNLEIIGTVEKGHGKKLSPRQLITLIKTAKEKKTKTLVIGLRKRSREIETIQSEIDGKIVKLDTLGSPDDPATSDIFKLLFFNAEKLSNSMKSNE